MVKTPYSLNENEVKEGLSSYKLALLQIRNEAIANFDLAELEKDITVRGEIYRSLLPPINSENEEERQKGALALKFALAALDKREFGV